VGSQLGSEGACAVIGLAARLGGADDVDEFRIRLVRPVPAGADRFGATASHIDPVAEFAATVRGAVEDAGHDPATVGDGCGLFATGLTPAELADVAARLGLRGPQVIAADALAATERAVSALHAGDCRLALVGGGPCAVAIKRPADALGDHDHVRALIRGVAISPAGGDPAETVLAALALADAKPEDMSYLELRAGSSLTPDAPELAAVTDAYQRLSGRPPATRHPVGVLDDDGLGGLAAVVKTVLALEHEQLTPSVAVGPDPLAATPFQVQDRVAPWPRMLGRSRLAAVVSAPRGASSAAVVLAEAPVQAYRIHDGRPRIVAWSGPTPAAELTARRRLAALFISHGEQVFADAVATLQHGRPTHPVRAAAVCTSALDAAKVLDPRMLGADGASAGRVHASPAPGSRPRRVVMSFPAEGSARALHRDLPVYANAFDGWLDLLDDVGLPAREQWQSGTDGPAVHFAGQAALADLWRAAGVRPDAVAGEGIGLIAADYAAGAHSPEAAAASVRNWILGGQRHSEAHDGQHSPQPVVLIDMSASTEALLDAAARLWAEGHDITWEALGQPPPQHRVPMPASDAEFPADVLAPNPAGAAQTASAQAVPSRPACALVVLTPPDPGPLLLALPYAGASGRGLQSLRGHLPPGFGLAVVDLPGHGLRMGEPCLRDVDAAVTTILEALPTLPTQRLVLFGYSLGGALAYEVACRLTEAGTPPEALVVCGARAPHTGVGHPPITQLPEGVPFLRMAVEMGLAAPEMVEMPELAQWYAGPLQADLTMSERFPFQVRRGRLKTPLCVVGLSEDWLVPEPSLRAWEELVRTPPSHVRIDGGHLAVAEKPQDFGAAIHAALADLLEHGRRGGTE
jgi:surfactin synthase thioesterase subunit/acyl transferase domain-containing protein